MMYPDGSSSFTLRASVRRAIGLTMAGFAGLACSPAVLAQVERDASALDEVVVTAQYREESLAKTPISMSAITADDLERNNLQQINDILDDVPGVTLSRGAAGSFFTIRGISSIQGGGEIDPGIAFNTDGIYNPFSSAALMSFYDMSRVEVLRGPQGTLYGRNAIAGVINVVTNDPTFDGFDGSTRLGFGNHGARTVTAVANVPVTDIAAVRLAGNYQTNDGYLANGNDDLNTMSWRAKAHVKPTDTLTLGFTFEAGRYWGNGTAMAQIKPYRPNPWEGLPDLAPPFQRVDAFGYAGLVQWDAGPVTVSYIPAYKSNNWDNQATSGAFVSRSHLYDTQQTHELRVRSNNVDSRLNWQGGAFYYDARNRKGLRFPFATIDQDVTTESIAGFVQTDYALNDQTRATAGLRFTRDSKTEDGQNYNAAGVLIGEVNDSNSSWNSWTYKVGLERDILDASMVYANVSTGFKAGGISLSMGPEGAFDPEKLTAYQIGMKNRLLGGRLSIDSEVYYYDYSNYQAAYTSLDPNFGGNIRIVANAGAAQIKGGEVESSFKITPNDVVSGSVSYSDGQFGRYVVPDGIGGFNDYSRSEINPPKWKLSASYRRFFTLGDWGALSPSVTVNYRSESYQDSRQYANAGAWGPAGTYVAPYSYQGGVTKIDAAVSYQSPTERVQVTAYANNLTNKASFAAAYGNPTLYYGYLEPPRVYGLTVDVKFGP
jgi:iron complex outermembrane receptor protein